MTAFGKTPPIFTLVLGLAATTGLTRAEEFNAGAVLRNMEPKDQYTFVAGIVEGLAHARFQADGHTGGRSCIYQWFYQEDGTADKILSVFASFPDHLPGAIVGAMIQRRCDT